MLPRREARSPKLLPGLASTRSPTPQGLSRGNCRGASTSCHDRIVRSALLIALCACGSEPTRAPDVASHDRAATTLDIPTLTSLTGTSELVASAKIIRLTGAPNEVAAQRAALPERGPALIAIGAVVTLQTIGPSLDALRSAGVSELGLVVTVSNARRMLVIEGRVPASADPSASVAIVTVGTTVTLAGIPTKLDALPAAVAGAGRVVVLPDRDITMQRLADVIAACGGQVFIGKGTLPSVTRSDPTP